MVPKILYPIPVDLPIGSPTTEVLYMGSGETRRVRLNPDLDNDTTFYDVSEKTVSVVYGGTHDGGEGEDRRSDLRS